MAKKTQAIWHPMFLLGSTLEDKGDFRGAIRAYRKAAKDGDSSSQSNLGNLLDDKIKPACPIEAVYWYKRAIRQGNWAAAANLATHYGNLDQPRWQLYWLKIAAKLGDRGASKEIRTLERAQARR